MSPGNRGPKDGVSGRSVRPSSPQTDPKQAQSRSQGSAQGPSTQTVPPDARPNASRRKRAAGAQPEEGRPRRRPATAPLSPSEREAGLAPDEVAEDAWAEYEEDANDWALTDEHSIAGVKSAAAASPKATTGVPVAASPLAAAPFDPQEHAVPRGPSYDPSVDLGSWQGVGGQDAQQRWPITATMLAAGRIRLGRGVDNDVVLGDPSISRAHAELRRHGERWQIVDMQSGNGTFVAGQRVSASPFEPGALLGLGSATYRLMLPGTQVQPEPPARLPASQLAPQPSDARRGLVPEAPPQGHQATWVLPKAVTDGPSWMRYTLLGAGCVVALGAAMGGWHMLRVWDIVGPLHTAMFEHYLDGVDALNGHKWREAEDAFRAVMEADPNSIRGKRYLAAAVAGRADEAKLAQAQAALNARDWPTAYRLAAELEESLFHDASRIITQQIAGHVGARVIEAQAALEAGDTKKAQALLAEADSIMPNRPDVQLLKTRADSTLGLALGSSPPPTGPVTLHVSPRRGGKRRIAAAPANLDGPLGPAISDFNDGNPDEALQKLDASSGAGAQAMAQNVRAFLKAYNLGLSEHRNKRAFAAVQALNQAKGLEAKIGGGQGKLGGLIDAKLADMYYVMGMQAYASGQFGEAHAAWRQALEHAPQHALSQSKLEELEQKAKGLVDEAESVRGQDTEKAKSLLRDAMQMVTAKSPTALRAQRIAASL